MGEYYIKVVIFGSSMTRNIELSIDVDNDCIFDTRSILLDYMNDKFKFDRLLFISGLDYTKMNYMNGILKIKTYNIKDFDKYMLVLASYYDTSIERIHYDRTYVERFFNEL